MSETNSHQKSFFCISSCVSIECKNKLENRTLKFKLDTKLRWRTGECYKRLRELFGKLCTVLGGNHGNKLCQW